MADDNLVEITEQSLVNLTEHHLQHHQNHPNQLDLVESIDLTNHALVIGQEFPDVETCRRALKDIAIALHFDLRIVKSDRSRFIAKCSKEGCPWRVHVAKCPNVSTFSIRTLHGEHTCEGVRNLHHQQASVGWVGFLNSCRPLLELDRAHLKGKYLGTLICASAVDADGGLFPLAFAVVDVESDENWMWFMSELRKLLGVNTDNMPRLTILSERQRGMVEAVETHFPSAFHGFCLRYVSENFRDTFKNSKLVNIFWSAVYALTPVEFESKISEMLEVSQDVILWLQEFPPQLWAVAYFEGVRYGHFTLGVTELLYNWALEGHELPVVQLMEHIRHQLTTWFENRQNMGMMWNSIVVPSAEAKILEAVADARCYQVLRANEVEFEVVSTERTNIVDIRSRVCSCRRWQIYGLPCAHAAAALISSGKNAHVFADHCFKVESYRETYSQMIYPIPDKSLWKDVNEGAKGEMVIRPPKTRRPPGRPKKKVLRIESLKRPKRIVQCGRCHMLGHSQKKCTMPI
ncbi:putative transcription factor WRKY family [Helianthus annuus]|nr:putative transcription factor WRKY family [Helianthus annuus]